MSIFFNFCYSMPVCDKFETADSVEEVPCGWNYEANVVKASDQCLGLVERY